jgi:hypothetical protein
MGSPHRASLVRLAATSTARTWRKAKSKSMGLRAIGLSSISYVKLASLGIARPAPLIVSERFRMLSEAIRAVSVEGLWMEFGVWMGESINYVSRQISPAVIHGFDSFKGLPESWNRLFQKGAFSLGGELPRVEGNVRLHEGWFQETLPVFLAKNEGPVAFAHVDCDLYSSTQFVLNRLGDRVTSGTVLVFDEFVTPSPAKNEAYAFREFVKRFDKDFECLVWSTPGSLGEIRTQ